MTTAEKIAVMQAFLDGKWIRNTANGEQFHKKHALEPLWKWSEIVSYEIMSEPKQPVLREWKPEEVPLDAWFTFHAEGYSEAYIIEGIDYKDNLIHFSGSKNISLKELKEHWLHSFTPFDPDSWKECGVRGEHQ